MSIREDQVANAVRFLQNDRTQNATDDAKKDFLRKKGLTEGEINESLHRHSGGSASSSTPVPQPPAHAPAAPAAPSIAHAPYEQVVYPNYPPQPKYSSSSACTPTSMADRIRSVASSTSSAMSPPIAVVVVPPQPPEAAGAMLSSSYGDGGGVAAASGGPGGRNPARPDLLEGREDKNTNAKKSPKQYPPVPTMPGSRPKAGPGSLLTAAGLAPAAIPMRKVAVGEGRTQIGFIKMMEGNKKPEQRRVPRSEVALHNKRSDCWVIFNNKVYDVTPYLPYHPGGKSVLAQYGGKDGTEAFYEAHRWISIEGLMSKCCLGPVCDG